MAGAKRGKKSSVVSLKKSSTRRTVKRDTAIVHFLVPKHEIVTPDERQQLMLQFGITEKNLAMILPSDPAIAHLQAKVNDIIKITRDDPVIGKYIFYRLVIGR